MLESSAATTRWVGSAMCHRGAVTRERRLGQLNYMRVEIGARVTALVLAFSIIMRAKELERV